MVSPIAIAGPGSTLQGNYDADQFGGGGSTFNGFYLMAIDSKTWFDEVYDQKEDIECRTLRNTAMNKFTLPKEKYK